MRLAKTTEPPLARVTGTATPVLLASEAQLRKWLDKAKPGDRLLYARGITLPLRETTMLHLVRAAFDAGLLSFVQRREPAPPEGPGGFAYFAIRSRRELRGSLDAACVRDPRARADMMFGGVSA